MLDAALIEGFQHVYLWKQFDEPAETPEFHRTMWAEACYELMKNCAWAAPRGHAKSSAITLTFTLAAVMFRFRDHILIVSDSEGQAIAQLKEIKNEVIENEEMRAAFGIKELIKDTEVEIIIGFQDGYQARLLARGSEQRLRGMKWRNKRPNMIIGDDLEFDEIVMNPERLKKFKSWFFKQLIPACSQSALIRIVGTILHHDSLLKNLMDDPAWTTHLWAAHEGFDDFSNILWPQSWSEERLRARRQMMINQGQADAYSQEYLNEPLAQGMSFFEKDDLLAVPSQTVFDLEEGNRTAVYYASIDLAVSTKQTADKAVITVGALGADSMLDIVDVRHGRWGAEVFVEEMFRVAEAYDIELWIVEAGAIQKSIMPFLNGEMSRRQRFLNLHFMSASKDKQTRAQSIRARMRAKAVRFDKEAEWWPYAETEMLHFPRGKHDDFVDTMSQFGQALEELIEPPTDEELEEQEYYEEAQVGMATGRNRWTGY